MMLLYHMRISYLQGVDESIKIYIFVAVILDNCNTLQVCSRCTTHRFPLIVSSTPVPCQVLPYNEIMQTLASVPNK